MSASDDRNKRKIRAAIEGAGPGFEVIEGGKRRPPETMPPDPDRCLVTALGRADGVLHFLDASGEKRALTARQLGSRHDLLLLFLGDPAWLRQKFPKRARVRTRQANGDDAEEEIVVDFNVNAAAAWLQRACGAAGLFGEHVLIRRPGIWAGERGLPVVHCGDMVLLDGRETPPGRGKDGQVWAAAPPTPRPDTPCEAAVGQALQEEMRELWRFAAPGGEIAVMGLVGIGYLGRAAPWRSCGFLTGGTNSGKSMLLAAMRAMTPLHHYSNNTRRAGVEQGVDGRAMPVFLDETAEREDQRGARDLMDIVLASTGGEGMVGHRGSPDGKVRHVDLCGTIVMASIAPPDMQPQHLGRFTVIELRGPERGTDHNAQHLAFIERCRAVGPRLWGRALAGFDRYLASLAAFRAALLRVGSTPREMDQVGALLAGWHVLVDEAVADERAALAGISALGALVTHAGQADLALAAESGQPALGAFLRGADAAAEDDGPRRALNHLLSTVVVLDRSTDREPIGSLIEIVLTNKASEVPDPESFTGSRVRVSVAVARRVLGNYGVRPIRGDELPDHRGNPAPRAAEGAGLWLARSNSELRKLFAGTPFAGERWFYELLRLESARRSANPLRFGATTSRALWLSRADLRSEDVEKQGDAHASAV